MKKRICFVTAAEITIKAFMIDHIRSLSLHYDIIVVTNTDNPQFLQQFGLVVSVVPVLIQRKISLIKDIAALLRLYSLFRKYSLYAVHSVTPKAGLLAMVAGFLAGVPIRIHTFTGQVWATRRGFSRLFFKWLDGLIAWNASHILVDSHSQRNFLINEGVVTEKKSRVLADGSICGVDTVRFSPNPIERKTVRRELSIDESGIVFLYLGRLSKDKGLFDLALAFQSLSGKYEKIFLLIVGPDEECMKQRIVRLCEGHQERLRFVDYTATPEKFIVVADVFCLPSYREGFGMAIIEAAAVGIPAIATKIYGITDAVEDNATGFLYEPHNVAELTEIMSKMIDNPEMRQEMGKRPGKG